MSDQNDEEAIRRLQEEFKRQAKKDNIEEMEKTAKEIFRRVKREQKNGKKDK